MNMKPMTYGVIVIAIAATLLVLGGTMLQVTASGCSQTYRVKAGDTLSDIAQRFDVSMQTLARLNRIVNPNRIYVGQRLCLPISPPAPTPTATATPIPPITTTHGISESTSQIVIEATYLYSSTTIGVSKWPFDSHVGVRAIFPLSASDAISATKNSTALRAAARQGSPPLLWIARLNSNDTDYTLISVGMTETLAALRLDEPEVVEPVVRPVGGLCPLTIDLVTTPLTSTIGGPDTSVKNLTIWLETFNPSIRYPIPISRVSHVDSVEQAEDCFGDVVLVVIPTAANRYNVIAVLSENIFGPFGIDRPTRCQQWTTSRDLLARVLRVVYGCRRR